MYADATQTPYFLEKYTAQYFSEMQRVRWKGGARFFSHLVSLQERVLSIVFGIASTTSALDCFLRRRPEGSFFRLCLVPTSSSVLHCIWHLRLHTSLLSELSKSPRLCFYLAFLTYTACYFWILMAFLGCGQFLAFKLVAFLDCTDSLL